MQSTSGGLALKRRPKATSVEPRQRETEIVQQVISIPIEKLHRHASNRTIPKDSVADLVQSLQDHGQREPIRVREHPDKIGHYEIISGERRFVAAQQVAGIDALSAIVEAMTDSTSIVELAVANAARKDLDPIERAELLAELIKPVAKGGGGMDRDAAGRIFGLNSDSGVKNTLRLLKLPKYFSDLLASGKKPIGEIRPLCAYPDAFLSKLADWVVKHSKGRPSGNDGWAVRRWLDDNDDTESLLLDFERNLTRPVGDKKHTHYHGYQNGGNQPCLFDVAKLAEADRTALQIVEIPDGKNGVRSVAMNVKAWHKLQDPLVTAKVKSKSAPPKESKSKTGAKAPTAAELKAKRKKQDDQLKRYTDEWKCKALRCTMANRTPSPVVLTVIPWMLNSIMNQGNCFSDLYTWATSELVGSQVKVKRVGGVAFRSSDAATESIQLQQLRSAEWWFTLWRVALWPVASRNDTHVGLATIGTIPDNMPRMDPRDVHELAAAIDVSMETVWDRAAEDGWERSLVLRWLEYHTREQLSDLAKSLKVTLKSDKRSAMVAELLEHHRVGHGRQLHLPAALSAPKVGKGKRGVR
jgi:ParB family transcriptional regulator, chromosome partitioning protein